MSTAKIAVKVKVKVFTPFKPLEGTGPSRMAWFRDKNGVDAHRQALARKAKAGVVGKPQHTDVEGVNDYMIDKATRARQTRQQVEWDLKNRSIQQRRAAYLGPCE